MNVSVAMTYGNVTEEILNSTTDSDALVIIVNSSPLWHLSVGVGDQCIDTAAHYHNICDSDNRVQVGVRCKKCQSTFIRTSLLNPSSRIDSDDSGAFTVSICSEGEIVRQTVDQKEESSSTDSFFLIGSDSLRSCTHM